MTSSPRSDQAIGAAICDELEDDDYFYMMQAGANGDGARERAQADEGEDGGSSGDGHDGGGRVGEGATGSGDGTGAKDGGEWGEMMGECSEERGRAGRSPSDGGGDAAGEIVGVGKARERVGPGRQRRVVTLARWEPSARAHMLECLENATIDVTGD